MKKRNTRSRGKIRTIITFLRCLCIVTSNIMIQATIVTMYSLLSRTPSPPSSSSDEDEDEESGSRYSPEESGSSESSDSSEDSSESSSEEEVVVVKKKKKSRSVNLKQYVLELRVHYVTFALVVIVTHFYLLGTAKGRRTMFGRRSPPPSLRSLPPVLRSLSRPVGAALTREGDMADRPRSCHCLVLHQ